MVDEYVVEVVLELWDAWDDDAAVVSRQTGQWADLARAAPAPAPRHTLRDVASYLLFRARRRVIRS